MKLHRYPILVYCLLSACASQPANNTANNDVAAGVANSPNIILILADDLGYGDVGVFGQTKILTPELDAMAQEGVVFTDFYAGSPVCGPSRASLLTGLHSGHAPIRGNPRWTKSGKPVDLSPQDVTIAKVLQSAGYRTGVIGKWGLAERRDGGLSAMPSRQGFDEFFGFRHHVDGHFHYREETTLYRDDAPVALREDAPEAERRRYVQDLFADEAIAFIERNAGKTPFFLYFASTIPHYGVTAPDDAKAPYQGLGWPERPLNQSGHYKHDAEGNVSYAAMVSRLDRDVGRILDTLKQARIEKNTIVIFTSDNGPEYDRGFFDSNGPFRGGKRDLYEGGIRMPTIMWWPGVAPQGIQVKHISAFWDVLPTFCDLAKMSSCPDNDGISFLPTLVGESRKQRRHEYLYWEFNERQGPIQAVRAGAWKLVKFKDREPELYNLELDAGERVNVVAQNPEITKRLLGYLAEARVDHPEFPLTPLKRAK